jgi:hypothetical protein
MERIVIDDRSGYTARASNPATGDVVLVGWDVSRDEMVYRLNGTGRRYPAILAMTKNPTQTGTAENELRVIVRSRWKSGDFPIVLRNFSAYIRFVSDQGNFSGGDAKMASSFPGSTELCG